MVRMPNASTASTAASDKISIYGSTNLHQFYVEIDLDELTFAFNCCDILLTPFGHPCADNGTLVSRPTPGGVQDIPIRPDNRVLLERLDCRQHTPCIKPINSSEGCIEGHRVLKGTEIFCKLRAVGVEFGSKVHLELGEHVFHLYCLEPFTIEQL